MTTTMTHENINGKHVYTCNGKVFRTSKREYRYVLLGWAKVELGSGSDSVQWFPIALGNNAGSLTGSWRRLYSHCELKVEEINTR